MSRHINELAEIVLDRVYKLGWQHRSAIENHHETAAELVEAERKLVQTEEELQRLRQVHMESQSEELTEARAEIETLRKQLDAAQAALTRERLEAEERGEKLDRLHEDHARLGRVVDAQKRGIGYLRLLIDKVRAIVSSEDIASSKCELIATALDEFDHGTIEPAPEVERCPECDKERCPECDESGMVDSGGFTPDGKAINVPCGGDCRGNKCPTEPTPVAEPVPCQECERLRAVVGKVRQLVGHYINHADIKSLRSALEELDANTAQPTTVAEPLDAEGGE